MKKFLCLLALLAGCVTQPVKQKTPDLALVDDGFPVAVSLMEVAYADVTSIDLAYLAPTERQIDLLMAYVKRLQHRGRYLDELWDCDDIAREFRVLASDWTVRYFKPTPPAALACATLFVRVSGTVDGLANYGLGGLHVMIALKRDDGVWFLIEPGNLKRTPLDAAVFEGTVEVLSAEL